MRNLRTYTVIAGTLAAACVAVACSQESAPGATPTPTPAPTSTPAPTPTPTPALPGFEASGQTGGKVGDTASEFTGITQWLNSEALTMEEMRGKVVLVDFWTYI
ncbi:MAG: hypothetical protein OXL97_05155 [Chloroflexota bacterium]|nr:hypothetical protein [Chloroflexota bacterium]MDE2884033.1 hypothetical protein [Chloroflexota bacterium]